MNFSHRIWTIGCLAYFKVFELYDIMVQLQVIKRFSSHSAGFDKEAKYW